MGATRKSDSKAMFLAAKHFCLWQELKVPVQGCETVEVTNPKTNQVQKKHGFKYDNVSGFVSKLVKYDTEKKYAQRYFGYKLHLVDGAELFVIDMPYKSGILDRFLMVAPSIDFDLELSVSVFKGRSKDGKEPKAAIVFRQEGENVPQYFTKDTPNGMPQAKFYEHTKTWDFQEQKSFLIGYLRDNILSRLEASVARRTETITHQEPEPDPQGTEDPNMPPHGEIGDDDVPF